MQQQDFRSDAWLHLKRDVETWISNLREVNDGASHDAIQTALIRGQIKALKKILDLPAAMQRSSNDDPSPGPELANGDHGY